VLRAHGIRGELSVEILTDDPHRFGLLERVYVGREGEEPKPRSLLGYRLHHKRVLLRIAGCEDRASAESLRDHLIQVPREEAIPLAEDVYFEHQIVGLDVWTASGEYLGAVAEIIFTGANEVYVVKGPHANRRELLIPAIQDVVLQVDLESGRLLVQLPEGLR
jgi:16S rRNA processing protein RimM